MSSKIVFYIIVIPIFLCVCFSLRAKAQPIADSVKWRIPLTVTDSGSPGKTSLARFAFHTQAVYSLPPYDVLGNFTDRWFENLPWSFNQSDTERAWPPIAPGLSLNLQNARSVQGGLFPGPVLIHPYTGASMIDTFRVYWTSDGMPIGQNFGQVMRWPSPDVLKMYADSIFLIDRNNPHLVKVDMTKDSNFVYKASNYLNDIGDVLVDPSTGNGLRIIIYHPKPAPLPPGNVTALNPPAGVQKVLITDSLRWSPLVVYPTIMYRLQVATDRNFQNIVVRDSSSRTAFPISGNLVQNVQYYWRVRAFTPFGIGSYKATPDSFKVDLPTPGLLFPVKGALNVTNAPKFRWTQVHYAPISYHLLVSSSSSFSVLLGDTTITGDTAVVFPFNFDNCDTIYWKVNSTNVNGPGPDTVSYFRVLFSTPAVPVQLGPADNATPSPQNITFSWGGRDVCTDSYRLQVTTDTLSGTFFSNVTIPDTSTSVGGFLGLTQYYWHVRAENGAFQSAYSAWRTYTTLLSPPAPPTLISPATASTIIGTSTVLLWHKPINNPTSYRLELDTTSAFNSPLKLVDSTLTDTTKNVAGSIGCTTYYWRVLASNGSGSSLFSTVFNFHVPTTPPDAPAQLSPADNAIDQPQFTPLSWSARGTCSTSKFIVVLSKTTFGNVIRRDTLTTTTESVGPLDPNTLYFWQVFGMNNAGTSDSSVRSFTTLLIVPPGAQTLISPPNGAGAIVLNPTLVWQDPSLRATSWRLEVAYDSTFTQLVFKDSTVVQPSKQVVLPLNNTWYYWRVTGHNDLGYGLTSVTWKFQTLGPPIAPTLARPLNGQQEVPPLATFIWSMPDGGTLFHLQVSRDSSFSNFVYNDSTLTLTTWTLPQWLESHKLYYWRVRAKNSAGFGAFSSRWSFRTNWIGPANWMIPLAVGETGPARDTIYMGIHPIATYGIDPGVGEFELPQATPGFFDCRFVDVPSRVGLLGEGIRVNLLPFDGDYHQVDTFRVSFQPGVGSYPMKLSWPKSFIKGICDSMVIVDEFGGASVPRKRMDIDSLLSVVSSSVSSLLIIEYGAFPLGVRDKGITKGIPHGFVLSQNYPNPFNPTTEIQVSTEFSAEVRLAVYDLLGKEVIRLINGTYYPGVHTVTWDGRNEQGLQMPSGVYYVRMNAEARAGVGMEPVNVVMTKKMIMMK